MATILAANSGLWTDPATWTGGVIPGADDVAVANGRIVTINASVTCAEVRNDTTGSATAGGRFALSTGVTLSATIYAGGTAVTQGCVGLASGSATIIGDVYAGAGCHGARNAGAGTLTIVGTAIGNGYGPGSTGITAAIYAAVNASTGALLIRATQQGERGMPAVSGPMQFIDAARASAKVRATSGLTEITLRAPDAVVPMPSDVRAGTLYAGKVGIATKTGSLDMTSNFSATGDPAFPGTDPGFDAGFDSGFGD